MRPMFPRRPLLTLPLLALLAALAAPAFAAQSHAGHAHEAPAKPAARQLAPDAATATPRPGVDFVVLEKPVARYAKRKAAIEVAEVFSYACIHCAHFQPMVDAWLKTKPKDVQFEYVPAVFGGPFTSFAAAFFAAESFKVRERSHAAVFKALFEDKTIGVATSAAISGLYARWDVDQAAFVEKMESPAVREQMAKARAFHADAKVMGTPTLVINGKYLVSATNDRSFPGMMRTLELVLARERKGLPPPAPGQPL
jgi:thiol:disulfide interchange protein DsbA